MPEHDQAKYIDCPNCEGELTIPGGYCGPVTHECGFKGNITERSFFHIDDFNPNLFQRIYYRICRLVDDVRYSVKCFGQRIKYGFPLYQSWDFKSWHSEIVVPRLKHLRNNLNGHPTNFESIEEWQDILDKMIWSFENIDKEPGLVYPEGYDKRHLMHSENGWTTTIPIEQELKVSFDDAKKHNERVQHGINLFAEYYSNLWD